LILFPSVNLFFFLLFFGIPQLGVGANRILAPNSEKHRETLCHMVVGVNRMDFDVIIEPNSSAMALSSATVAPV
jgi:hypothetical protein